MYWFLLVPLGVCFIFTLLSCYFPLPPSDSLPHHPYTPTSTAPTSTYFYIHAPYTLTCTHTLTLLAKHICACARTDIHLMHTHMHISCSDLLVRSTQESIISGILRSCSIYPFLQKKASFVIYLWLGPFLYYFLEGLEAFSVLFRGLISLFGGLILSPILRHTHLGKSYTIICRGLLAYSCMHFDS